MAFMSSLCRMNQICEWRTHKGGRPLTVSLFFDFLENLVLWKSATKVSFVEHVLKKWKSAKGKSGWRVVLKREPWHWLSLIKLENHQTQSLIANNLSQKTLQLLQLAMRSNDIQAGKKTNPLPFNVKNPKSREYYVHFCRYSLRTCSFNAAACVFESRVLALW